jgi:hypothetical protein
MVYDSNPLNRLHCERADLPCGWSGWAQAEWAKVHVELNRASNLSFICALKGSIWKP